MNLLAAELRRIQRWCDLATDETRLTLIDGAPADAWTLRQALPTAAGTAGECSGSPAAADGPGRSTTTPPVVPAGTENATPDLNPKANR